MTVAANVKGAEVFVDGKSVGMAPLEDEVFVEPGARTIEAKLAGYVDGKKKIDAAKGSMLTVTLSLVKETPPPPPVQPAATGIASAAAHPLPSPTDHPPVGTNKSIVIGGASAAGVALVAGIVLTALANGRVSAAREKNGEIVKAMGVGTCAEPTGACGEVASMLSEWTAFKTARRGAS